MDAAPPRDARSAFTRIDLTDFGQVVEAFSRIDSRYDARRRGRAPRGDPRARQRDERGDLRQQRRRDVQRLRRRARGGIRNVVWASSETVLGLPFDEPPPYLPVDEEVPWRPETTYSLGKVLDEEMARQFCRWDPELKMIGLRFSNVMEPADYAQFPAWNDDPSIRKWNLWSYIDARDGAQAVRRALEHEATRHGRLHHRERRHRHVPAERRAGARDVSRRADPPPARRARHAALDRQGAASPRLRAGRTAGAPPDQAVRRLSRR